MTTHELGRLQDLPQEYRDSLRERNLVPLWPSLRALLPPGKPRPATRPTRWSYQEVRPLLMLAGDLTPIEKAERRVLVLANPGHGDDSMRVSAAIYLGMQLLLPGEWAPSHRHTPNAVRLIVEGSGAYTTVDGEKCVMERGDLILTPSGTWHEHGHDGTEPVVWLDILDLPLVHYLENSYAVEGTRQEISRSPSENSYAGAGMVPAPLFSRRKEGDYPILKYSWRDARASLLALANDSRTEAVQLTYVNPETGSDAQNILGYHALMLRPGQTLAVPPRSPAVVFHCIEGSSEISIGEEVFSMTEADTCCAPGFAQIQLHNASLIEPAFYLIADEGPLHRKLGLYEQANHARK